MTIRKEGVEKEKKGGRWVTKVGSRDVVLTTPKNWGTCERVSMDIFPHHTSLDCITYLICIRTLR